MSGPALRQLQSHQAIHTGARQDTQAAFEAAEALYGASDHTRFSRVVEVFLEVVEARVLTHAREEEAGLYQEWLTTHLASGASIEALALEHRKLQQIAVSIEEAMVEHDHRAALSRMRRLLTVSEAHSRHEEEVIREITLSVGGLD